MSGLVIVYSRALIPGEFVRVENDMGRVTEVGTLSTKILTRKREKITIPNAVLVGTKTINYSRHAASVGVLFELRSNPVRWRQKFHILNDSE